MGVAFNEDILRAICDEFFRADRETRSRLCATSKSDQEIPYLVLPLLLTSRLVKDTAIPLFYSYLHFRDQRTFARFLLEPHPTSYRHIEQMELSDFEGGRDSLERNPSVDTAGQEVKGTPRVDAVELKKLLDQRIATPVEVEKVIVHHGMYLPREVGSFVKPRTLVVLGDGDSHPSPDEITAQRHFPLVVVHSRRRLEALTNTIGRDLFTPMTTTIGALRVDCNLAAGVGLHRAEREVNGSDQSSHLTKGLLLELDFWYTALAEAAEQPFAIQAIYVEFHQSPGSPLPDGESEDLTIGSHDMTTLHCFCLQPGEEEADAYRLPGTFEVLNGKRHLRSRRFEQLRLKAACRGVCEADQQTRKAHVLVRECLGHLLV